MCSSCPGTVGRATATESGWASHGSSPLPDPGATAGQRPSPVMCLRNVPRPPRKHCEPTERQPSSPTVAVGSRASRWLRTGARDVHDGDRGRRARQPVRGGNAVPLVHAYGASGSGSEPTSRRSHDHLIPRSGCTGSTKSRSVQRFALAHPAAPAPRDGAGSGWRSRGSGRSARWRHLDRARHGRPSRLQPPAA